MPIFRIKSVKIYTGHKNSHEYTRGVRDKYQVWVSDKGTQPMIGLGSDKNGSGWIGDTPQTLPTSRAPAVLLKE